MLTATNEQIKVRAKKLLDTSIRVIYHASFDNKKMRKVILAEVPELDKLLADRNKIRQRGQSSEGMRPCYEEPLLNKEQEAHLFRKMNYFKYRAKKLQEKINLARPNTQNIKYCEKYLSEAYKLRNQLATSNFRLATQIIKPYLSYKDRNFTDVLLSDAYSDVLRAVDYFDFSKGNKFSTYCTWVMRRNFNHEAHTRINRTERYMTGMSDFLEEVIVDETKCGYQEEIQYTQRCKFVKQLLDLLATEHDAERKLTAIQDYFGVNDRHPRTFEEIGKEMGVSKERARQLRNMGVAFIREKALELGLFVEDN